MKDKYVGFLMIAVCIILLAVIISYDLTLNQIVNTQCTHGTSCPMYASLKMQRIISFTLLGILTLASIYFLFLRKHKQVEQKTAFLTDEEKQIIDLLKINNNSLYQTDIIKQTNKSKVQITRILDKLEAKRWIERQRRGMTNIIILK